MYRIILLSFILCISLDKTFSQCTETPVPKVLLVGDSWAAYMNTDRTINDVLKTWGHSNYRFVSNATLSENGADTRDFVQANKKAEILNQLNLNPSIEVVHLSIGGNDFLGDWNVNMTQAETDTLTAGVFVRLDSIISFIKSCKPGIKILWSGYCYTNFKEVITGPGGLGSTHPFYSTWNGMGQPDFAQINTMQNSISVQIDDYCATHPDVYYYNANALMQYVYGQPTPLTVAPGGTYPAYSVPMPLGDPNYPSPVISMRDYDLIFIHVPDCYHLSAEGYRYLVGYHAQKFYHKLLMDDLYLLSANNNRTGTVTSASNTFDSLSLGESGGEQFATVLSFNTSTMIDTTLEKASIFLRRKSLSGTNPISGNLQVRVKSGNFGTTVNVDAADFADNGDASATPCLFGSNTADGDWIRLDLPSQVFGHITNSADVQFIISAPGFTGGKVNFYDSSDDEFAPVLNLNYTGGGTGVEELTQNHFTIYPNPTDQLVTIKTEGEIIQHLEVADLLGKIVLTPAIANTIDVSSLSSGMYILNITTKNGRTSQRVIKN